MIDLFDESDSDVQKLNEIERKRQAVIAKRQGKENKLKILFSEFILKALQEKSVTALNSYVIENFENSLSADDKKSLSAGIKGIKNIAQSGLDNDKKEGINSSKSAENSPAQPQQIKPTVSQNSPQPA